MTNSFGTDTYRSNGVFAIINSILLGISALCGVIVVFASLFMLAAPDTTIDLGNGDRLYPGLLIVGLASALSLLLRIVIAIFFLIWEHRAYKNLSVLRARNLEFSPGWAVGWWFIPFANLVKPFQVMRELWNESDPDFDEETGFLNVSPGTPSIIGFWWGALIINGIVGRIIDKTSDASMPGNSDIFAVFMIISGLTLSVSAVLALFIVKNITQRQDERLKKVLSSQQFDGPPPPPSFN